MKIKRALAVLLSLLILLTAFPAISLADGAAPIKIEAEDPAYYTLGEGTTLNDGNNYYQGPTAPSGGKYADISGAGSNKARVTYTIPNVTAGTYEFVIAYRVHDSSRSNV